MRLLLLYLLLPCSLFGQPDAVRVTPNYTAPVRGPLLVTGTFGELRSDHFHAGIDFRAPTDTPVYAVADGFVSRVVVSPGGFGQAVYVDHPDGYRSVYAHLESFNEALHDTVRARQFADQAFAVDLRFDSTAFPVRAGERLGGVGNRGHSFGPHLHFEMRERDGDVPVNPLAFGFDVPDTQAPQIRKLRVYEIDNHGLEHHAQTIVPQRDRAGSYYVADTILVGTPSVGLALKTYDRQNGRPNRNGIYGGALYVDSTRRFGFTFDRIPFADTEYLNAWTDYADWTENESWFQRFWRLSEQVPLWGAGPRVRGDRLKEAGVNGSVLRLKPGPQTVRMAVRDYAGNVCELSFVVSFVSLGSRSEPRPHQYFLPAGEASIIAGGDFRLELGATALYRDCFFTYARLPDASAGYFSDVHQLHDRSTPLHGRATVTIRPNRPVPDSLRAKIFLGHCNEDGRWTSYGGRWTDDGRMSTTIPVFGDYALFVDTVPPTVEVHTFPTDLRRRVGFSVAMTDNVSGGRLDYRGTIDGRWVLLEYDAKSDRLTYTFADADPGPGEHLFAVEVKDARGNRTVWKRRFRR